MKPIINDFYHNGKEAVNAMKTFWSMVGGVLTEEEAVSPATLYRDYLVAKRVAVSFGEDTSKFPKDLTEFLRGGK